MSEVIAIAGEKKDTDEATATDAVAASARMLEIIDELRARVASGDVRFLAFVFSDRPLWQLDPIALTNGVSAELRKFWTETTEPA